jgi:hypothetical protein
MHHCQNNLKQGAIMAVREISAKTDVDGKTVGPVTVKFDFGTTLEDKTKLFGAEVTNSQAEANMVVGLQDVIRGALKTGKVSAPAVQAVVSAWKPGIKKKGKSKAERLMADFLEMPEEARREMLADMKKGE